MTRFSIHFGWPAAVLAGALLLNGCSSSGPAPVEERGRGNKPGAAAAAKPASGQTYTVKPGDTLYKIAVDHSVDYRELMKWNNLDSAALIKVGQVLRLTPDPAAAASAAESAVETTPIKMGSIESRPLGGASSGATGDASRPAAKPEEIKPAEEADSVGWIWPSPGKVVQTYDGKNKGLDIAGKVGDAVIAAADGKVVYSGNGLRGYGNLIVVKHNESFLSAYAHNRSNLVTEGQAVKRGQKIAEMGNSDADRVKLHFEIRRQGKPVDPLKYLPER
jgi:lipoprotein NlpD